MALNGVVRVVEQYKSVVDRKASAMTIGHALAQAVYVVNWGCWPPLIAPLPALDPVT